MAVTRTPPDRWIEAGLGALADGGPDAVRVEALAEALGVSKGGFYWQFDDRSALLDGMLDQWERAVVDDVIERVEGEEGDARAKLRRLFAIAGTEPLEVELAVRDWARRDPGVAARLRRVDNRRMDYMRDLFSDLTSDPEEVETRCLLAFSLWIGNHFIAADHGGRTREEVVAGALRGLVR
jgi:AcrR family transcriptional regulator